MFGSHLYNSPKERVTLGGDQRILASALWEDFNFWCAAHKAPTGTQAAFGARLQAMGVHLAGKDRRGRKLRHGATLRKPGIAEHKM